MLCESGPVWNWSQVVDYQTVSSGKHRNNYWMFLFGFLVVVFFSIYHYETSLELCFHQRVIWWVVWWFLAAPFYSPCKSISLIAQWEFCCLFCKNKVLVFIFQEHCGCSVSAWNALLILELTFLKGKIKYWGALFASRGGDEEWEQKVIKHSSLSIPVAKMG